MKSKELQRADGLRTYGVVFDIGEDPAPLLVDLAREHDVTAATLTGIGAFRRVVLAYFEWESKQYRDIDVGEQVEVVSLVGNIARTADGDPKTHVHVVVAKRDGTALGGHLRSADVRPTLEIVLTETPAHLARRHDEQTGLALLDLDA